MGLADEIDTALDQAVRSHPVMLRRLAEPEYKPTLEDRLNIVIDAQKALSKAVVRLAREIEARC